MRTPGFAISESPTTSARGIASLERGRPKSPRWGGQIICAVSSADAYGVTDTDGSRPDCWGYCWPPTAGNADDGAGIDDFR